MMALTKEVLDGLATLPTLASRVLENLIEVRVPVRRVLLGLVSRLSPLSVAIPIAHCSVTLRVPLAASVPVAETI